MLTAIGLVATKGVLLSFRYPVSVALPTTGSRTFENIALISIDSRRPSSSSIERMIVSCSYSMLYRCISNRRPVSIIV
uniref:Putative secreted protein n=1 Tax=Anopheles darlingi TaxID=43151 RepID=A0A2M4D8P3_ANODA